MLFLEDYDKIKVDLYSSLSIGFKAYFTATSTQIWTEKIKQLLCNIS